MNQRLDLSFQSVENLLLYRYLDPKNHSHKNILDLIRRGLVTWAISDEDGELQLSLTEAGKEFCELEGLT